MRLMSIGLKLTQVWQIIIIDLEYTLYIEEQAEREITRIGQINYIIAHFLVCYNIEIERRIKYYHCKWAKMIKRTIQIGVEKGKVSQSSLTNQVQGLISLFVMTWSRGQVI